MSVPVTMPVSATFVAAILVGPSFVRTVTRLVFSRFYKVHRPVAGVVLMAMFGPFFRVTGRYMQIYGFYPNVRRLRGYDHRLRIDNRWRGRITESHLPIGTRGDFTTD